MKIRLPVVLLKKNLKGGFYLINGRLMIRTWREFHLREFEWLPNRQWAAYPNPSAITKFTDFYRYTYE
jgi:hypothetical protein